VAKIMTMRLGEILVQAGVVSNEKLELALKEQRQTGEHLGAALHRLGICSEQAIAKALADQVGVECVDLSVEKPTAEVAALLTPDYADAHTVLPLSRNANTLKVVMGNPTDIGLIDEMGRMTGLYIEVAHAPEGKIRKLIARYMETDSTTQMDDSELVAEARSALASGVRLDQENSPFVRLVDHLIARGVREGATDIHIEPEEKVLRCRYRLDGRLIQGETLPRELLGIVVTRIKIMAEMNISESRVPQDGRIVFNTGRKKVDLRVSTLPNVHGELFASL
jgi:type IV pilus assembly protein PilB